MCVVHVLVVCILMPITDQLSVGCLISAVRRGVHHPTMGALPLMPACSSSLTGRSTMPFCHYCLLIDRRNALGIPNFNYSNIALNFTASKQHFLSFGFEQFISMDILEETRSGQINLGGLESDILYPFDWYLPLDFSHQHILS